MWFAFGSSETTKRASDAIRSQRIGLRLYAIADDPICSVSNGSSISPTDCSMRMSPLNFIALAAMPATDAEHLRVELARVRLARDGNRVRESDRRGDAPVELAHLCVIAVEDLEEAGLRPRRALHAAAGQRGDAMIEVGEVEHEILHPERRALADGRGLRRLQVRGAERRLVRAIRARTRRARGARGSTFARSSSSPRRIRIRSALSVTYALVAP